MDAYYLKKWSKFYRDWCNNDEPLKIDDVGEIEDIDQILSWACHTIQVPVTCIARLPCRFEVFDGKMNI